MTREELADILARTYDGQPLTDLRDEHAADHLEAADRVLEALTQGDPMTDRLTPEREAEIQQRAEAATPGPWEEHAQYGENFYAYLGGPYLRGVGTLNFGEGDDAEADKALTVNAREDIRTLLVELSAVRAERDTAHAELEQLRTSRWDATKVVADLESRLHATHSELTDVLGVLARLANPEACRWEGVYCITHSWRSDTGTCPHGEAQQLLGGAA